MSITNRCKISGCTGLGKKDKNGKRYLSHSMCMKHYTRYARGEVIDRQTRLDKREVIIEDGYVKVPLNVDAKNGYAIVDMDDLDLISEYKWYLNARGYAITHSNNRILLMHHLIMGKPSDKLVVDHINRIKTDNRKSNLRFATISVNGINSNRKPAKSSGVRGVVWSKSHGYWVARISADKKLYVLGCFRELSDAIDARRKGEAKYHTT